MYNTSQSDGRELIHSRIPYTEDELADFYAKSMENQIAIAKIEEEVKEINKGKKDLQYVNKIYRDNVRKGFKEEDIDAHYIDDDNYRIYFRDNGEEIQRRRLKPGEKIQLKFAENF